MSEPSAYPQHERFKAARVELLAAQKAVDALMIEARRGLKGVFRDDDARELTLPERDRERLIFGLFGIDYDAFYREKEEMVRRLQESADAR